MWNVPFQANCSRRKRSCMVATPKCRNTRESPGRAAGKYKKRSEPVQREERQAAHTGLQRQAVQVAQTVQRPGPRCLERVDRRHAPRASALLLTVAAHAIHHHRCRVVRHALQATLPMSRASATTTIYLTLTLHSRYSTWNLPKPVMWNTTRVGALGRGTSIDVKGRETNRPSPPVCSFHPPQHTQSKHTARSRSTQHAVQQHDATSSTIGNTGGSGAYRPAIVRLGPDGVQGGAAARHAPLAAAGLYHGGAQRPVGKDRARGVCLVCVCA
jgi:hypothetical protein